VLQDLIRPTRTSAVDKTEVAIRGGGPPTMEMFLTAHLNRAIDCFVGRAADGGPALLAMTTFLFWVITITVSGFYAWKLDFGCQEPAALGS